MPKNDPRTAEPDKSIWRDLPEDTFRQHLVDLEERTNAVPIAPITFSAAEWVLTSSAVSQDSYVLPIEIEQELADDFACLAAVEEGAQSVAAVCIEEHPQPPRLTLRFAALDTSLNEAVHTFLQNTSDLLSKAGLDSGSPTSESVDALFHLVVQLHFHRLLARLRSKKWEKPKYLSKSHKKPLWQDFPNLIHRVPFVYTKKEKIPRQRVEKLLGDLAAIYEGFELTHGDDVKVMEDLVMSSFGFSSKEDIKDFLSRLESSVGLVPTSQVGSAIKSLRQIQKIAAYRRIPISLVRVVRDYPRLFEGGIRMAYVTPYQSVPTTIKYEEWATTCHVHAEVQLAAEYDLFFQHGEASFLPPRTIGISKWLCYLCYQFLRAHRGFFAARTHGRLYDQWTIPDLARYNEDTMRRYRQILKDIDEEVIKHTTEEPGFRRLEPMTSIDICSNPSTPNLTVSISN